MLLVVHARSNACLRPRLRRADRQWPRVIWIDLSTAPDPLFFRPLIPRLAQRGHEVWITARDYSETVSIAEQCGLSFEVVGHHGGASLSGKARAIAGRARLLSGLAATRRPDAALSFNSYAQALAALRRGIPFITVTDYEHQPANHLAFRLARRIIVPEGFDPSNLRRQGAAADRVVFFRGLKEDVTLADFEPDPLFGRQLEQLGIAPSSLVVTMRPPATSSTYHRFGNDFFLEALAHFASRPGVSIVLLPRYPQQADRVRGLGLANVVVVDRPLDGLNLVAWSDAVISAGGSMNREAVALGTPAYTVFAGRMAGVDDALIAKGLLTHLQGAEDLERVTLRKKERRPHPVSLEPIGQVLEAVLSVKGL